MLSAHGSAPEVVEAARARGGVVVDAVCPLVTKVHHELKVRSRKGYTVLYVGHAGHEEAVGTMAVAPESVQLIEDVDDLDALGDLEPDVTGRPPGPDHPQSRRVARPHGGGPRPASPTCGCPAAATSASPPPTARPRSGDRGARRRRRVIGSANSSNTVALEKVARRRRLPRVLRVNEADELPDDLPARSGSPPVPRPPRPWSRGDRPPGPAEGVDRVTVTTEDEYFPPPRAARAPAGRGRHPGLPGRRGQVPIGADPAAQDRPSRPAAVLDLLASVRVAGAMIDSRTMTFTRMDESTAEQWQVIMVDTIENQPRVAERVLRMLESLEPRSPTASR